MEFKIKLNFFKVRSYLMNSERNYSNRSVQPHSPSFSFWQTFRNASYSTTILSDSNHAYWHLFRYLLIVQTKKSSTRGLPTVSYRSKKSTRGKTILITQRTTARRPDPGSNGRRKTHIWPRQTPERVREISCWSRLRQRRFISNIKIYAITITCAAQFRLWLGERNCKWHIALDVRFSPYITISYTYWKHIHKQNTTKIQPVYSVRIAIILIIC